MKILTDDPDWKRDVYEARALAMAFIRKRGRPVQGSGCLEAARNGLTVRYDANRSPVQLTVDTTEGRVLSVEWKDGDAWRMEIETYRSGRWESRLKAVVQPRPWLKRCRALLTFTGTLPPSRTA
jgi:hypothetical protein